MPIFTNCKSRIVKSKTGKKDEDPFIMNIKKTKIHKTDIVHKKWRGKDVKVINSSQNLNKKFSKEVKSKTGSINENKYLRY